MKVATALQMKAIDLATQTDYGISAAVLMERAALAAAEEIRAWLGPLRQKAVYIFCGKGNNGGDGLALARQLTEEQARVTAVILGEPGQYSGQAAVNLQAAEKYGVRLAVWPEVAALEAAQADLIVDAILGTGTSGVPGGAVAAAIELMNSLKGPVLALDLPSGVNVDTGAAPGPAVRAGRTVTFGLAKPGLMMFPGAELAGTVVIRSIGFPKPLLKADHLVINVLELGEIEARLPRRASVAHKGSAGHVAVIGGSPGMTGAVALAALGALRTGCGLVTVGLGSEISFPEKPREVMVRAWPALLANLASYDCLVFGPGLGTTPDGPEFLARLKNQSKVPLVIDADGLNMLAGDPKLLPGFHCETVFTPHPGEMARLTRLSSTEIQGDRLGVATHFAHEWGVTVVLKGARTVTAFPDGQSFINPTGNPGMATAGSGDVLSGMIGALIAQGMKAGEAAAVGVYLHGLAGDLAMERYGFRSLIAGDLIANIPNSFKKVSEYESS